MQGNREQQEISVMGRLLSLEALVVLMGIASLVYGVFTASILNLITGAAILCLAIFLFRRWRR